MRVRTTAIGAALTACSGTEASSEPGYGLFTSKAASPPANSAAPDGPQQPKALGDPWTWASDRGQQLTATATSYTQPTPHFKLTALDTARETPVV
jgi:hypothetical protein